MDVASSGPTKGRLPWGVIIAVATLQVAVVGASATAAWNVRGELASSKLADYEAADALKLSGAVKELRSFSQVMKPAILERQELERLRQLPPKVASLEGQLASATAERDRLRTTLNHVVKEGMQRVEIPTDGSARLIPNGVLIGALDTMSGRCELSYADESKWFSIGHGDGRKDPRSGLNYRFQVAAVSDSSCTIDFEVETNPRREEQS